MPIPYGIIWNRLESGKVVPFLGAGASLAGRPADPQVKWDPATSAFLPSGAELARFLADEANLPSEDEQERTDLGKVASYYQEESGRAGLCDRLRKLFNRPYYRPGPLHRFLAALDGPLVMVVTNYDTLLEQAFRDAGKPYELVVYPADRKDYANALLWWPHDKKKKGPFFKAANEFGRDIDLTRQTVIFKMHGTVSQDTPAWDNFVITEEDYLEFLYRMTVNAAIPALFSEHFRERSFLFLGYSLRDWNLRLVLHNLSHHFASRGGAPGQRPEEPVPSWAIQRKASEVEKKVWEQRRVNIFEQGLDEFVEHLSQTAKGIHAQP